jgi:hypothetical protein
MWESDLGGWLVAGRPDCCLTSKIVSTRSISYPLGTILGTSGVEGTRQYELQLTRVSEWLDDPGVVAVEEGVDEP